MMMITLCIKDMMTISTNLKSGKRYHEIGQVGFSWILQKMVTLKFIYRRIDMSILVADIKFYVVDDDGNEKLNKEGTHIQLYQLKRDRRFKALEYLTEDMDMDLLEEINE